MYSYASPSKCIALKEVLKQFYENLCIYIRWHLFPSSVLDCFTSDIFRRL